ncbi:MAG: rhodanese-like domain-containing protein [Thermoanaerobaculia bacterium]|nr:rhodanese-like domain-containing protein [Thermoanaerobaculia bacterium]
MHRTLAIAPLLALLLLAAPACAQDRPRTPDQVERVSAAEAKAAVDAGEAILVDVRHESSYRRSHAAGAIHLYPDQVVTRWKELPREKLIVTYCT